MPFDCVIGAGFVVRACKFSTTREDLTFHRRSHTFSTKHTFTNGPPARHLNTGTKPRTQRTQTRVQKQNQQAGEPERTRHKRRTEFTMAKKAAKASDETEPSTTTKKATAKKPAAAAKKTVSKSKEPKAAAPAKTKAAKAEKAEPAPKAAPKKTPSKKKAPAETPDLFEAEPAAPAKAKTTKAPAKPKATKAKAAKAAPEPEAPAPEIPEPVAVALEPAAQEPVAPPPTPAPPAPALPPVSVLPPASVPQQDQQGQAKPRPLYIPREVEAFLRAAGLPIPTEKPQLDAILAAMNVAKMAAQQAAGGQRQQQPQQQQPRDAAAQPSQQQQNPQQPQQPRLSREERRQQHIQQRREQREQRRQQHQQQNAGDGQPPQQSGDPQNPQQPRPPRVEEPVELVEAEGFCEISGKGFGFIRDPKRHFQPNPMDVFVTPEVVKRFGVKDGHWLKVEAKKNSRGMQINRLLEVNGQPPENVKMWPSFEDLTTISPIEHIKLETVPDRTTTRIIDMLTPIGKGQRGLIVAPPRTGKTTLLNHIADAVVKNHPDMHLMILLVDERPEEVTDFRTNVPKGELWASSNDMDTKSHTRIATLAIERARRLVESGRDVFILLDSITRLGRAFNNAIAGGGRTMSGGVDSRALEQPRKFFAAARNTEEAGSLTIVATALIETGSRMDELIFQEFKGTGNSEIVLDRKISDLRIYPAIDIFQSGTRREELILPADQLNKINVIRRGLAGHKPVEAIERMLSFVKRFPTNEALLREIPG